MAGAAESEGRMGISKFPWWAIPALPILLGGGVALAIAQRQLSRAHGFGVLRCVAPSTVTRAARRLGLGSGTLVAAMLYALLGVAMILLVSAPT